MQTSERRALVVTLLTMTFFVIALAMFSWGYVEAGRSLDGTEPGSPLSLRLLFVACFASALSLTMLFSYWVSARLECSYGTALLWIAVPVLVTTFMYLSFMSFTNSCVFGHAFPLAPTSRGNCG